MRVLFDTNVVLDVLLERAPHAEAAAELFSLCDRGEIEGFLCATTLTTVFYLAARQTNASRAAGYVRDLLELFKVAQVDADVLRSALSLAFSDFEDAVIHEAARAVSADVIVTRDQSGFRSAQLLAVPPVQLMAILGGTP